METPAPAQWWEELSAASPPSPPPHPRSDCPQRTDKGEAVRASDPAHSLYSRQRDWHPTTSGSSRDSDHSRASELSRTGGKPTGEVKKATLVARISSSILLGGGRAQWSLARTWHRKRACHTPDSRDIIWSRTVDNEVNILHNQRRLLKLGISFWNYIFWRLK